MIQHPQSEWKRDEVFFRELEEVLDEHFPKVEEDGTMQRAIDKSAVKRGEALMLFAAANTIHSRLLHSRDEKLRERIEGMRKGKANPRIAVIAQDLNDEWDACLDDILKALN